MPIIETVVAESPLFSLANWFLLSLYIVRILYCVLHKLHIKPLAVFVISILLAYTVNRICYVIEPVFVIGSKHILFPFYFGNIFYGLAFYSLGYLLKKVQFHKIIFGVSILIYIIHFFYYSRMDVRADIASGMSPAYALAVIYNIAGIIVINNIFIKYIASKVVLLTYIGKNSMIYYVTHYIILNVMVGLFQGIIKNAMNKPLLYIIFAIVLAVILFFVDRLFVKTKFKIIIGER